MMTVLDGGGAVHWWHARPASTAAAGYPDPCLPAGAHRNGRLQHVESRATSILRDGPSPGPLGPVVRRLQRAFAPS